MKRPAVFITSCQSPFQIVHDYQDLLSEYIFQKCYHPFNIVSIFFNFQPLLREKL